MTPLRKYRTVCKDVFGWKFFFFPPPHHISLHYPSNVTSLLLFFSFYHNPLFFFMQLISTSKTMAGPCIKKMQENGKMTKASHTVNSSYLSFRRSYLHPPLKESDFPCPLWCSDESSMACWSRPQNAPPVFRPDGSKAPSSPSGSSPLKLLSHDVSARAFPLQCKSRVRPFLM